MSRDLAAVMVTVDRSPRPNYLAETLGNLRRSGVQNSHRLSWLAISDSGPYASSKFASKAVDDAGLGDFVTVMGHYERAPANQNVADSLVLRPGGYAGERWRLFLEDDIDVCADFFDSVAAWLDDHARADRHVYAFGANYTAVNECLAAGEWDYPVGDFYGTQAFALRAEDAESLAGYLGEHCFDLNPEGTSYDLLMHRWALGRWPEIGHFLASAPSFVQHVGRSSVINPRPKTHTFQSWPGREWSYRRREAA